MRTYWTDEEGRKHAVEVPPGQEHLARHGIPVGPPDLSPLGLPLEVEVRLHNALFDRQVLTARDAKRRPAEVQSAVQYALKASTTRVLNLYLTEESDGHDI